MKKVFSVILIFSIIAGILSATPEHKPGDVLVKFRSDIRNNISFDVENNILRTGYSSLDEILQDYSFTSAEQLIPDYDNSRNIDYGLDLIYLLHSQTDTEAISSIEEFEKNPFVEYAELNIKLEHASINAQTSWEPFLTPNDPSYSSQWFLPNISAPAAWDIQTGNHSHIVAIVDLGVEMGHADLSGNYITGYDYVDNDNDPTPATASEDHGTHCSGCAAAVTNNSTGIASIGYGIGLIGVRTALYASQLVSGINFSAQNGADAISMSWISGSPITSIANAIDDAYNNYDVVCIAAAGNYSTSTQYYPAAGANTVAVAATNSSNQHASFTNYGTWIDISAPGDNIYSTVPFGNYAYMSGTSMSCPLTAGLVTLMRCQFPTETNAQIIQRLYDAADAMPSDPYYNNGWMGAGKINAYNSLQGGTPDTSITVTVPNGGESWDIGSSHNITWSDNNVSNFDIHYSTNSGSNWILVANNHSSNTYGWTIPNTPSTQCRVRVRDHSKPSTVYDASDGNFTIASGGGGTCDTLTYWDWGLVENGFNYGDPPEWMGMGVRFTPTELSSYHGDYIEHVIFQLREGNNPSNDAMIYIFGDGTSTSPGDTLYQGSFTVTGDSQWYDIDLGANHVQVNSSGDMWILVGFTYQSGNYPFSANEGSYVSGKSDWAWTNSGNWEELGDYSFYYGWTVGAVVCTAGGISEEIGFGINEGNIRLNVNSTFCNDNIIISFNVPISGEISLKIYDLTGREIRSLVDQHENSGSKQLSFNGRDGQGQQLSAGSYFFKLTTECGSETVKFIITE